MERSSRSRPPATLASLAAEVGVSRTTVSNAYNRPDQLSPALRARVMEAAARLGYPGPDPVARSLRTRKAGAIGLLLTEQLSYAFRDPAAVAFLEGLTLECDSAKVGLLLVPARPDSDDVTAVAGASVDGFVAYSMPDDDPHLRAVLARPVPAVICDQPAVPGTDLVGIDDHAAARGLADHLVELGHRRIGVVCMRLGRARRDGAVDLVRQQAAHYHVQRNRLAGLREGFTAAGVAWDRVPVVEQFDHSVESGARGAAAVLAMDPGITALIATSDVLAMGAIDELHRRRQRVPEDVSVSGFDGIRAAREMQLTTVVQPVEDKGRYAGRLLLDPARSTRGRKVVLPTTFLAGQTTAPPRVR
ncbi:LacI family DNA-binding transcriptional regulator [Nakamurella sp. YIM 132087]|uniref:LacI family DNA-binding transcriptional regulator n=1 Tax=Nakamurella alba TaxID=2665158 RepID=A0A7K1FQ48_9ACTN|nr:LacI family DNA-binding transcriptional regulator [Nakamurella alba]MTD16190.1 LacI family DNA-binding transcriptional regulator [Nakamurella alba]